MKLSSETMTAWAVGAPNQDTVKGVFGSHQAAVAYAEFLNARFNNIWVVMPWVLPAGTFAYEGE